MLHNNQSCAKRRTIARAQVSKTVRVVMAYEWNTSSDNTALVYDEVQSVFRRLEAEFPALRFNVRSLGGKDGSIYCDICRQIRSADAVIADLSTNNLNVVLELGMAIGAGTNVFILRSNHYKRRPGLSDLNGILEYRFSRVRGQMNFGADFRGSLERRLRAAARAKVRALEDDD